MIGIEQLTAWVGGMTAKQGVLTVLFLGAASTTGLNYKIDETEAGLEKRLNEKLDLILDNQTRTTEFLQRELDYMHTTIGKIENRTYRMAQGDTVFFSSDSYGK